ncbi:MAG: hypothetical protein EGQ00_13855 [Parabacteroides johnsonii]|nr:hypothetical protein [Parabacteroides johnsonii]
MLYSLLFICYYSITVCKYNANLGTTVHYPPNKIIGQAAGCIKFPSYRTKVVRCPVVFICLHTYSLICDGDFIISAGDYKISAGDYIIAGAD